MAEKTKEEIVSELLKKLTPEETQVITDLAKELKATKTELEDYKKDLEEVFINVISILRTLGIVAPNDFEIKPEIRSGEENALKIILKKLGGIMMDATIRPSKVEKDFEFLKNIGPLLEKNAKRARKQQ